MHDNASSLIFPLVNERTVYPPIQQLEPRVLAVVVVFVVCFVVGVSGNATILTIIQSVLVEREQGPKTMMNGMRRRGGGDNAILYIAALCVVDFLMSLSLPPAILDSIIGFWMFGTIMCKVHHGLGSVGRIVSTFLITAMSFDRFVAVCLPMHIRLRSRRNVILIIAALLLLLPMLIYARANEIVLHTVPHFEPHTGQLNITRVRVYKCTDMMPRTVFYVFTTVIFLLGYVVPLLLIVFFNGFLIRRLYTHTRSLPKSGIPLRRVVVYTILVAISYFVCWTPYWASVLYAIFVSLIGDEARGESSELFVYLLYCVHLLPYICSAGNWILYGLLNTQLQMRQEPGIDDDRTICMSSNIVKASSGSGVFWRLTRSGSTGALCRREDWTNGRCKSPVKSDDLFSSGDDQL